ncbi:MAG: 1-acyl-sn-glycerol-3-phosphate acyltransferase, partial [Marmoricola sp.]|nr:1-acyl-sn-glycerol-3-phosphate acyltransferase [Marmoricola sp.]
MRDLTYPPIILTAKTLFRVLGLNFQLHGTEQVPRTGGALLAFNHVSYVDFILGGFAAHPSRRLVRFMAKREVFDHQVGGPVMRSMHHISVDRADGGASMDEALRYLQAGEVVGIFPEATISRSFEVKELKSGATRIAAEAGVPLIPVALWGTQRLMTKDHPSDFGRGKTIGI